MANAKISALTALTGAGVDTAADVLPIVDTSVTTTKKIAVADLMTAMGVVAASPITNSLGADVNLNNTANYFDGPSVAQGTTGTWFASGTVTLQDVTGNCTFYVKLWDGTTVIASAAFTNPASGGTNGTVSLSGYIASPAGNLRISVRDTSTTGGVIKYNVSGNSKDSTITAFRIA